MWMRVFLLFRSFFSSFEAITFYKLRCVCRRRVRLLIVDGDERVLVDDRCCAHCNMVFLNIQNLCYVSDVLG